MAKWWVHYTMLAPDGNPKKPAPNILPDPRFAVGAKVRLRGKPEQIRHVREVKWHWIRAEYCYIVETSAPEWLPIYWFAPQLQVVE